MTARRPAAAWTALPAAAALALLLAQPCAAQPYADERWGPIPPPGKGLPPRETPLCDPHPESGRTCEFPFGPNRRLRVPTNLLHPVGVTLVRGYRLEIRDDKFLRHVAYENEGGLLRLTWGGLRSAVAALDGTRAEPAPGDEARLQIGFTSRSGGNLDRWLDERLALEAPNQAVAVRAARESGADAVLAFANRQGEEMELVFRGGRLAIERRCDKGYEGSSLGTCKVRIYPGDASINFWYYRSAAPSTEEAAALVLALLDSFVVEGPKFTAKESKPPG